MYKFGQRHRHHGSLGKGRSQRLSAFVTVSVCALLSGSAVIPPWLPMAAGEQQFQAANGDSPVPRLVAPTRQQNAAAATTEARASTVVWVEMEFAQLPPSVVPVAAEIPSVADPAQPQILLRAAEGDADAAFELGSGWRLCQGYSPDSLIDTEQLLQELQQPEIQPRLAAMQLTAEEVVALTRTHQDQQQARCPQLMAVLEVMGIDDARDWLTLAADAGRSDALTELAALELDLLQSLRSQTRDQPHAAGQRDQRELSARDFVEQALLRGDSEALALRARMRLGDNLGAASREARLAAYADLLAYEALRPVSGEPHLHSTLLRQLAEGLDSAGLREASEQAVLVGLELGPKTDTLANAP